MPISASLGTALFPLLKQSSGESASTSHRLGKEMYSYNQIRFTWLRVEAQLYRPGLSLPLNAKARAEHHTHFLPGSSGEGRA